VYLIKQSKIFKKSVEKLIKQRRVALGKINKVVVKLSSDPFDKSLVTHKVNTRALGLRYSSRVDGDLRIIWSFDENENLIIHLLDIGGHSGAKGVY
jgi:mRNA-degrading endonuclease YafQ of YafQ-DinJ toxin-antitoxin module